MKKICFGLLLVGFAVFNNCKGQDNALCNTTISGFFDTISCGDSVNFNGAFYRYTGSYSDTFTSSQGCDSIITMYLTTIGDTINQFGGLCAGDSFYFFGTYIHSPGSYDTLLPSASGCDTLAILNLVVQDPLPPTYIFDTICGGDSIAFNGGFADTTGTYTSHYSSQSGCDSIVIMQLTVVPLPVSFSLDSLYGAGELYCCNLVFNTYVDTVWCLYQPLSALTLTGGSPPGGIYTGTGISGNILYADNLVNDSNYAGFDTITYTVSLNGCPGSAWDVLEAVICTGIKSLNPEESVLLYPNPAGNAIVLQSYWFSTNNIIPVLYDVTGKEVALSGFARQQDELHLNTAGLSAGVYFIKLNINGNSVVKRFVKLE